MSDGPGLGAVVLVGVAGAGAGGGGLVVGGSQGTSGSGRVVMWGCTLVGDVPAAGTASRYSGEVVAGDVCGWGWRTGARLEGSAGCVESADLIRQL